MKKPANYWKSFSNVKKELAPFIKKYKRLPSSRELKKAKLESLYTLGINKHGGVNKIAKLLNTVTYDQHIGRANQNFWTFEKTTQEIIDVINQNDLKYFPTKNQLNLLGRQDLLGAIRKFKRKDFVNCQLIKVRRIEKRGKVVFEKPPKDKIWNNRKIKKELKTLYARLGYWPSGSELDELGMSNLRGAIQRNGGQIFFWRLLGRPKHKDRLIADPDKYNTKTKVLAGYRKIKSKIGRFPSYNDLVLLNERALAIQKNKYFSSNEKLYSLLGQNLEIKNIFVTNSGKYVKSQYELLFDNILNFYNVDYDYESLISNKSLKKYKYDFKVINLNGEDIYIEIWGYNEKHTTERGYLYNKKRLDKVKLYKKLNLRLIEIDGHKFLNGSLKYVYKSISKILLKNKIIKKIKSISKVESINLLNAKLYDEKSLKKDLEKVVKYYGHLPAYGKLTYEKFGGLRDRFMKIGGFPYLRKKYKIKEPELELKWTKEEVKKQIIALSKKYKKMPTYAQFKKESKMDLFAAMYVHYGGSRKCALKLNLKHKNLTTFKNFNSFEKIVKAVKPLLEKNKIPSIEILGSKGPNGLRTAVNKMGLHNLAIKMNKELIFPQFKHRNYLLWYLKKESLKLGFLPSSKNIRSSKYDGFPQHLRSYIKKLGGHKKVANILKVIEQK